ncbi:Mechanosensitive ion channel protein 10-like protein [Drosera capensis]
MSFIFGKRKTPAELLRENKRMLDRSIREIERERQGLQAQEKKLIVEIKKSAKQGQMGAVRVMAKDLIRTRHQVEKFYKLKSQLQGVSLRVQTLKSTQAMGQAMKGVTKAMGKMNRQLNLPGLQKIMQEFERQNEKMELTSEVMGDAIDDALEGDEEEEETDELVNQVLDEIGINVDQELVHAPSGAIPTPASNAQVPQAEAAGSEDVAIDDDLQARYLDHTCKAAMDTNNAAAESATARTSDDVIVSITAISASSNRSSSGNPLIKKVLGAETILTDPISQMGFAYKSPDRVQTDPSSRPNRSESLNLGTQLKTEITKISSTTTMSSNKPPRSPNDAVVARRPSRVSSGFLRAKSRLVEPPHPSDHDHVNLDDESSHNVVVGGAKSPYRDTTPNRTPPRVSVSTPKASPITPKTPLMAAVQGGDDDDDNDNDDVYKTSVQTSTKKGKKVDVLLVSEWGVFVFLTALLIASLMVDQLVSFKIWSLAIWKWCVLAMVMFCGRLINEWLTNVVVFLIERNFVLKKKVLYFVYGMKRSVQVFLWLAFILLAWGLLFSHGVKRLRTTTKVLNYITKALAGFVVGSAIWLVKSLFIKTVAVTFHVRRFFDRIQESLFHQYVLQALSGPPLVEIAEQIGIEKATAGSGKLSFGGNKAKKDEVIDIDRLNKMKQEKVSAWTMRGLIKVITGTKLSTITNSLEGGDDDDGGEQTSKEITSEWEAKSAANQIFKNVAKPGYKYIEEDDLLRFLKSVEVELVFPLFAGATESGKINKSALTKWVVNAYLERKFLAHSLNDTKTAVEELNKIASGIVLAVNIIVWNLMMGFLTTKILLFISSQLLLVVFVFGNTAKTVFEALIFVFIMHPFDVGDRCVIDGVQMVVDEMNILTTIFLKYDNEKIIYPNSVLATKPVSNFYRSPEMSDSVEFSVDFSTSIETLSALKTRIKAYVDSKPQHWRPSHSLQITGFEDMNKMNLGLYVGHTINFQNSGEKSSRKCDLLMELKKIFEDLGIKYHPLAQEVHVTHVGSPASAAVTYR